MNKLNPYITFLGNTRQAMEFYKTVFGGNLTISTFKDMNAANSSELENLVMHSDLTAENGMTIMASDDPEQQAKSTNTSISLSGDNEAELKGYWDKLTEGATIIVPFEKAAWGDTFGMLTDKFGIRWLINATKPKA
ncbi:MAG TPA: VOC family protein [Candidatus Saccharimonadales bacterium]|nr:VOC family protein [Candidatus Saccharimonadales bacterium]